MLVITARNWNTFCCGIIDQISRYVTEQNSSLQYFTDSKEQIWHVSAFRKSYLSLTLLNDTASPEECNQRARQLCEVNLLCERKPLYLNLPCSNCFEKPNITSETLHTIITRDQQCVGIYRHIQISLLLLRSLVRQKKKINLYL